MRLGSALFLLTLCSTSAPSIAHAQDPPPASSSEQEKSEYDRLIDEALSEFDAGHFDEALSAFEQAYKVKPSARALRGIAKALFELRSYVRAVRAIDKAFASEVDPLTGALRADLESLRARAMRFVGEAVINVAPPNATVLLDGEGLDLSSANAGVRTTVLDVGPHTLDASAPDHEPQHRKFEIHGGETTQVTLNLPRRLPMTLVTAPPPPQQAGENKSLPLALTIGGIVLSTGAVVGSSIWLVDRGDAVDQCNEAAASGAHCANADSVAFQRNASFWTLGLSTVALVASTVALILVLRDR